MALVIDASALIPLVLEDEESAYSDAVIAHLIGESGIAPAIFWFEIRNAMIVNERRRRLSQEQSRFFLHGLTEIGITIDDLPPEAGVLELARRHQLSIYDAAYLDLAVRSGHALATLDGALRQAAQRVGVAVFKQEAA